METAPGPAFEVFDGKLNKIEGNVYVVDRFITDYRGDEIQKQVRVYVNNATIQLRGNKRVDCPGILLSAAAGQRLHAEQISLTTSSEKIMQSKKARSGLLRSNPDALTV